MPHPVVFSEIIKDATSDHGNVIGARYVNKEKKTDEVTIVVEADTVVHPWAVVV